jgi:hypothetical protein
LASRFDRNIERANYAAFDLAACAGWADSLGLHLMIEANVTRHFAFAPADHFPSGTVDLRDGDAVSAAVADPSALLVTAGGHWWGMPVNGHPQWKELRLVDHTWAVLVVSMLSGGYYGLHVDGAHNERFVNGLHVRPIGIEAILELADGATVQVVQTNVDFEVEIDGKLHRHRLFSEALEAIGRPVIRVDSSALDDAELATAIEVAGLLPDRFVVLNGRVWARTPALRPDDTSRQT